MIDIYPLLANEEFFFLWNANEEFNTLTSGPKCLFNFSLLKYIVALLKKISQMTAATVIKG